MKVCKRCGVAIEKSGPRANNVKFCSTQCRESFYRETGMTKKAIDKCNHNKYNKFAPGKEQCIICEGWYWAVCHHATQRHNLNHAEYKKIIGADVSKGRITPALKEKKAAYVIQNGTINNLIKGAHRRYIIGDRRAGRYERSRETLARLSRQIKVVRVQKI